MIYEAADTVLAAGRDSVYRQKQLDSQAFKSNSMHDSNSTDIVLERLRIGNELLGATHESTVEYVEGTKDMTVIDIVRIRSI